MELVYLWIKKYKNIEEQGFNFSPRFHCKYDEENNELTIDENKDYIPDFFGKNINVTAIVGKNGSGKSSILKFLRLLATGHKNGFVLYYDSKRKKFKYQAQGVELKLDIERIIFTYEHISLPMFDYSLTYDPLIKNDKWHPLYPNKEENSIIFNTELIRNQNNIINNYKDLKNKKQVDKFENFFQPNKILINIDLSSIAPITLEIERNKEFKKKYYNLRQDILNNVVNIELIKKIKNIITLIEDNKSYKKEIKSKKKSHFHIRTDIINPFKIKLGSYFSYEDDINNIWSKNFYGSDKDLENIIVNNRFYTEKMAIIDNSDEFIEAELYSLFSLDIDKLNRADISMIMASFSSAHFQIELITKNEKKLSDLSFGEQQLLFILNQLYSLGKQKDIDISEQIDEYNLEIHQKNLDEEYIFKKSMPINNYIVLLDEIDIGFHPDWQKKTIQYLIDFLSLIPNKNFHLIFTTHSPFLLSDIPKENIVFLNDKPSIKQTFGANIHTLLSDSFFMEEGLMGEFAKSKIDKAIKLLNKERLNEEELKYCEQIISIIGEPIVKNQLQRMLDSKRLKKIDEIDKLYDEIELIKHRIDILRKD